MIWSHWRKSQAKLVLVIESIFSRPRALSMTKPQQGEALHPFCGALIRTSTQEFSKRWSSAETSHRFHRLEQIRGDSQRRFYICVSKRITGVNPSENRPSLSDISYNKCDIRPHFLLWSANRFGYHFMMKTKGGMCKIQVKNGSPADFVKLAGMINDER